MNSSLFLFPSARLVGACVVASILSIISLTTEAEAQGEAPTAADIKKAADAYDQGRERFRDANYTEAAEKFEAADDYAPSAAAVRLAMAARKEAGQLARAASLAALALERYPDQSELKSEADAILSESTADLAKVHVTCDVECELTLNNRLVHGRAAQTRTLYVEPGKVILRASWSEGRTDSERLKVAAGDFKEVSFYAPAIPDVAINTPIVSSSASDDDERTSESNESKGWSPAVFWTGTALTLGGGVASAVLGVRALNHPGKQAILDNCESGDTSCPDYVQGRRNQTVANVAIGTTAALGVFTLVTGIWLTNWGDKDKKDDAASSYGRAERIVVRPLISVGNGAYLGAQGTF